MRVLFLFSLSLVLLSACSTKTPTVRPTAQQLKLESYATRYLGDNNRVVTRHTKAAKPQGGGYWKGEGVSGPASIVIDLGRQEARFYKGGELVGRSPISSGATVTAFPRCKYVKR